MRYRLQLVTAPSRGTLERHLRRAGVDPAGIRIMSGKAETIVIRVDGLTAAAANILKQQMLSLGADAAVHRDVIRGGPPESSAYCIADRGRFEALAHKLGRQPFGLAEAGEQILRLLTLRENRPRLVPLPGGALDLSAPPLLMGVLNITPDSFSDGGRFLDPGAAVGRAEEMIRQGAAIIDIGGESTRPGASETGAEEELRRVLPVIERLAPRVGVPLSIDTRHAAVARRALSGGASIINDISGLRHDPLMAGVARETGAAVVVMHMQGRPETMQDNPRYKDAPREIIDWLEAATRDLVSGGIAADKIIVDPGLGFGKGLRDNLEIIDSIGDFHTLGFPLCVGYSRKSFIGAVTGREDPGDRICGGLAAAARCIEAGVQILRVHDVEETADFIALWREIGRKDGES